VAGKDEDIWHYRIQIDTVTRKFFESSAADLGYVKLKGRFIKECGRGLF
jgi:hypothetical protein